MAKSNNESKLKKLSGLLGVTLLTIGVCATGFSFTFKADNDKTMDALNTIKTHYINAVEVEAQVTTIPDKKNELVLSLVEDGSKFWIVDKNEFENKKEDFEKVTIIVDDKMENVLRGEQYCLDGEFYNLIDNTINTDELTELDYTTYKELEHVYTSNVGDTSFYTIMRMNGITSIALGVILYAIKYFIK